ncbi:MAG: hypothetical protein RPU91_07865 [Candidatus Sedimenticola sp. (ex Thyasira tokunagai)]
MNLNKILFIFLLLISSSLRAVELNVHLSDPEHQSMLMEQLTKKNIPFKRETSGNIQYPEKYYNEVTILVREIISSDLPANRSVNYFSPKDRDNFISKLKESNIPYSIKHRHDGEWVIWEDKDSEKVKRIAALVSSERKKEFEKNY